MEHCLTLFNLKKTNVLLLSFIFTQLQPLLYKFRCRHLQQHLHYVIENAESKMSVGTPSPKSQGKQHPTKDIRSSLYARIGLTKDKDNSTVLLQWHIYLITFFITPRVTVYISIFCFVCADEGSSSEEEETKENMTDRDSWLQHCKFIFISKSAAFMYKYIKSKRL